MRMRGNVMNPAELQKKTKDLVTSGFRKGIGGFLMADEWTESCLQNS